MKITMIAMAVIVGLYMLLMPALVQTPDAMQERPGSDPAKPH